jgi:O-antigen biosynthesis protein
MMESPSVIILTGMHRSGTSMIARFLHNSGINMGETLLGPHPSNPYGHFEDINFLNFHREVLRRENKGEDQWVFKSPIIYDDDVKNAFEIISPNRERGEIWGWKEPRTCLFLNFWGELIPEGRFLFVFRDPFYVLDSLGRRHQTPLSAWTLNSRYLMAWIYYNKQILNYIRLNRERSVIFAIEKVLKSPEEFINKLNEFFGLNFTLDIFNDSCDLTVLNTNNIVRRRTYPGLNYFAIWLYRQLIINSQI